MDALEAPTGHSRVTVSSIAGERARALALPIALSLLAAVGYAAAAIFRYDHYGATAYDLGIFDQSIWGYSHFDLIHNTVRRLPTLGDHFHPILILLAPLYWIWDDARVLLLAQAFLLSSASLPLYAWTRRRLGTPVAVLFQSAFLLFWGVLAGNLADFHEVAVACPLISLALFSLLTRRHRLLATTTVLAFLTKEDLALTFAAIGLYMLFVQRLWRFGSALFAASLLWFAAVFELILPAIAGRSYVQWVYPALGSGPGSALRNLFTHPIDSVRVFFTPESKRVALLNTFAPWLALPLLSPLLIVLLPSLAERFFSTKPALWEQGFHYSLVSAPILAFAAVDSTERLSRTTAARIARALPVAVGIAVVAAGAYFSFARLRPLDVLERYTTDSQISAINACLATIPPDASVAATSALVPHLTHRSQIYVLDGRPVPDTDIIAIDTSTWMFPFDVADASKLVHRSLADGFGVRCSTRTVVVLERGHARGRLSPELLRQLGSA